MSFRSLIVTPKSSLSKDRRRSLSTRRSRSASTRKSHTTTSSRTRTTRSPACAARPSAAATSTEPRRRAQTPIFAAAGAQARLSSWLAHPLTAVSVREQSSGQVSRRTGRGQGTGAGAAGRASAAAVKVMCVPASLSLCVFWVWGSLVVWRPPGAGDSPPTVQLKEGLT